MTIDVWLARVDRLLIIATAALLNPLIQMVTAQEVIPSGIGFAHFSTDKDHGASTCSKAGWLNPFLPNPEFRDFTFQDLHFADNVATSFGGWLRGGQRVIINRISWRGPGSPLGIKKCDTIPMGSTGIDGFILDLKTRAVVSSPTTNFRRLRGNQAYFYSENLAPLYADGTNRLTGFILVTHPVVTDTRATTEVWQISPDGAPTTRQPLISQGEVGGHGCQVSPNGKYLACETPDAHGVFLAKIDGAYVVSDLRKLKGWRQKTLSPLGVVSWSSDSAGFVLYSCSTVDNNSCDHGGNLLYYDIATENFTSLAPDFSPSFFCYTYASCRNSGASGSEIPAASPVPGWFYYSALIGSTNGGQPRRVVGSVSRDDPNIFHPLTFTEFTEPGHPAVSSDNKTVAFIANFSSAETRAALYSVDVRTQKVRRLGRLATDDNIYAIHWRN